MNQFDIESINRVYVENANIEGKKAMQMKYELAGKYKNKSKEVKQDIKLSVEKANNKMRIVQLEFLWQNASGKAELKN